MEFRGTQTCFLSQYINFIEVSRVGRSQNGRNASHASGITCHFFSFLLCPVISNYPKTGLPRDPRMTSMFRRGTIFATFFLSLLGGGLVCAALVTQHWVEARPFRTPNPQESAGRVHFGLLQGKKELNVAYGWRTYHISGKFYQEWLIRIDFFSITNNN